MRFILFTLFNKIKDLMDKLTGKNYEKYIGLAEVGIYVLVLVVALCIGIP